MGVEASRALVARRRQSSERIARLVAATDELSSAAASSRRRISLSLQLARRRLRALAVAQRTVAALEVELGRAIARVEAEGISFNEVFRRLGLPRHLGRKYLAAARAAQEQIQRASSTGSAGSRGASAAQAHLGRDGSHPDAYDERKL